MFMALWNKKYRVFVLILSASIGTGLGSCSLFDKEVIFGGFQGVILDKQTGQPIEGAVVFVHWQSEIVKFEIAGGPPVYLNEVVTDKNGVFKFENSPPQTVKLSTKLRDYAPVIGVIKEGYGMYFTSIGHEERGFWRDKYLPLHTWANVIELERMTDEQILSYTGLAIELSAELREIINPYLCVSGRIPKTLSKIKKIAVSAKKLIRNLPPVYYSFEGILEDSVCHGNH
jgi:hypothetical protein